MKALAFIDRMFFENPTESQVAECMVMAKNALKLAPGDELAHWVMAKALSEVGQTDDAIIECERALEINPNCTLVLSELAAYLGRVGRTDEAIETAKMAIRLNPRDPTNFWNHFNIAKAHFIAGNYEAAFEGSRKVARSRPHAQSAIIWAASAAALGKTDETKIAVENCLALRPDLTVGTVVPGLIARFTRSPDHERLLSLLRQAGLPD
jgi:tetratricopeptide (TPR) repeat protein